jgi:hypothetical protein
MDAAYDDRSYPARGVAPYAIERSVNQVTGTLSPISLVHNRAKHLEVMRAAVQR